MSVCDCEPTTYDDGSIGHEQDCDVYPWCPHEVVAYACLMPCGCSCAPCQALTAAHRPPFAADRDTHINRGDA